MRRTSRCNVIVDDVTFESWATGIQRYRLISKDGKIVVGRNYEKTTYFATFNDEYVGRKYRTELAAIEAAVHLMKGPR